MWKCQKYGRKRTPSRDVLTSFFFVLRVLAWVYDAFVFQRQERVSCQSFLLLLLLLRCGYIDSKMSMVQIAKANSLFLINIYALCCRWNNFSFHQFFSLLCVFKLILINSLSSFLFCFFFLSFVFFLCVRFFWFVLLKRAMFMEFSS